MDGKAIVRDGYNRIARAYLATRDEHGADVQLLAEFAAGLPASARVLDAGCGAGVPATRVLTERHGCRVTGVDIAEAQVALARTCVPGATFLCADMTALEFPAASFDGICSLYAIIHVPRQQHAALLHSFRHMLVPGGLLLASLGRSDSPADVEDDWLGAGAPMYWSHFDQATNLRLLAECGFELVWERLVREAGDFGGGEHLFVLARKPVG